MKPILSKFLYTIRLKSSSRRLQDICWDLSTVLRRDRLVPIALLLSKKGFEDLVHVLQLTRLAAICHRLENFKNPDHEYIQKFKDRCLRDWAVIGKISIEKQGQLFDWVDYEIATAVSDMEADQVVVGILEDIFRDIREVNQSDEKLEESAIEVGATILSLCCPDVDEFSQSQSHTAGMFAYTAWVDAKNQSLKVRI